MTKPPFTVILFYRFVHIRSPKKLAELHRARCMELGLKGRIIIAGEGINATLEGSSKNIAAYKRFLKSDRLFANIPIKESVGTGTAFPRLAVKIRDEIVTLGAGRFNIKKDTAKKVSAKELEKLYENNEDFVVLDLRNDYETASGKFDKTVDPGLKNFRDLPKKLKKLRYLKNKKVIAVCTGGIRCEKATCLLKKEGFTDLYQLEDGIHTYMKEYPGQHFRGSLFVFDNRMLTDVAPTRDKIIIGRCAFCTVETENYYSDDSQRPSKKVLCCKDCRRKEGALLRAC